MEYIWAYMLHFCMDSCGHIATGRVELFDTLAECDKAISTEFPDALPADKNGRRYIYFKDASGNKVASSQYYECKPLRRPYKTLEEFVLPGSEQSVLPGSER